MRETYDDLIGQLDLAAKVRLLTGQSFFALTGDDTIGLSAMAMSDGPAGVKGQSQSGGEATSLLPNPCSGRILGGRFDLGLRHRHDRHPCVLRWPIGCW
jgi:beta-glucosidase